MRARRPANILRSLQAHLLWLVDGDRWRVPRVQRPLYRRILFNTVRKTGMRPRVFDGEDFNNKLRWLMLFDQSREQIAWVDKLAARERIAERVGAQYLPELYQAVERPEDIDWESLPRSFVIKTNHDSGGVWKVRDRHAADWVTILEQIRKHQAEDYGWNKGEWYYTLVPRRVLIEEYLAPSLDGLTDFKYHCSQGEILLTQIIGARDTTTPWERVYDRDGADSGQTLNANRVLGSCPQLAEKSWGEMQRVAETLSRDFRYVRVDLYCVEGRVLVGEISLHPKAAQLPPDVSVRLGPMLDLDRRHVRPPVVHT